MQKIGKLCKKNICQYALYVSHFPICKNYAYYALGTLLMKLTNAIKNLQKLEGCLSHQACLQELSHNLNALSSHLHVSSPRLGQIQITPFHFSLRLTFWINFGIGLELDLSPDHLAFSPQRLLTATTTILPRRSTQVRFIHLH